MKRKALFLGLAIFVSSCAHLEYVSEKEASKEVSELKEKYEVKKNDLYDLEVEVDVEKISAKDLIKGICQTYKIPCVIKGIKEEEREISIRNFKGRLEDLLSIIYEQTGLEYGIEKGVLVLKDYQKDDEINLNSTCKKPVNLAFKNAPLLEVLQFFNREYGFTFVFEGERLVPSSSPLPTSDLTMQGQPQSQSSSLFLINEERSKRVSLFYNGCDPREAVLLLAKQLDVVIKPIGEKAFSIEKYERLIVDKSVFFDYVASLVQSGESGGSSSVSGEGGTGTANASSTSSGTTNASSTSSGTTNNETSVSISENYRDNLEAIIKNFLSPEGKVSFSPRGYVIVEDRPSRIALIREILKKEKKKEKAIKIKVQIYRIDLYDEYQAGIDWNLLVASQAGNWQNVRVSTNFASGINGVTIQGDYRGATNVLKLLQQYGKVKLVKEFQSVGRAGLPIVFTAIDRIPYVTTTVQTGSTGGATAFPQINYEEAGLKIIIHPNIQGSIVDLNTAIEVSEYKGDKAYNLGDAIGSISIPLISKHTISIPARIPFGETLIITGFHVSKKGITGQGLPEVAKLPVVGELFGYKNGQAQNSELIFIITPERVE